jgi:methionine salvage enolase-phosphatase E1
VFSLVTPYSYFLKQHNASIIASLIITYFEITTGTKKGKQGREISTLKIELNIGAHRQLIISLSD